jgi:predicted metal-dependent enzyme (double-stranded beta helix superfamily)
MCFKIHKSQKDIGMNSQNDNICRSHLKSQESQSSYEDKNIKLMQVNRSDRLRRNVKFVCGLNELKPNFIHYKEVNKYLNLATQSRLSDEDMKQLEEILNLAYQDLTLGNWIEKIDHAVEKCSERLSTKSFEKSTSFLDLNKFLYEMEKNQSENITLETFESLVSRIDIDEDTINSNLGLQDNTPYKKSIYESSYIHIFVMTWKPGQYIKPHGHQNDLSIIQVYKGCLSHKYWKKVLSTETRSNICEQAETLKEGESTRLGFFDHHELANQSDTLLVTLHFRYSKQLPKAVEIPRSIDEPPSPGVRKSANLDETIGFFFR